MISHARIQQQLLHWVIMQKVRLCTNRQMTSIPRMAVLVAVQLPLHCTIIKPVLKFSTSKSYMPAVAIIHVVDILLGFSILSKLCKLSESSLLTATNFSARFDMD